MPRYYEDAAHLLLLLLAQGVQVPSQGDHTFVLMFLSNELDRVIAMGRSHAATAETLIDTMTLWGCFVVPADQRRRVLAVTGTVLGNLITMKHGAS